MSNILIDPILRDVPHMVHFAKDGDGIKETKLYSEEDLLAAMSAALDGVDERTVEVAAKLRMIHEWKLGRDASDLITALLAQIATLRAERDALKRHNNALSQMLDGEEARAETAEAKVEKLRGALEKLEKASSEVSRRGAETGPQWSKLTIAILQARAALTTEADNG